MTNDELPELEPFEDLPDPEPQTAAPAPELTPDPEPAPDAEAVAAAPMGGPQRAPVSTGLPAPAYNPNADKEYYRFLLAGLVMLIGCFMPFGPELGLVGYKTLSGALCTVIAVGMVWSWWGAIGSGRFSGKNLKWVGLALIPLMMQLLNMLNAFQEGSGLADWAAATGREVPEGWSDFFSRFFAIKDAPRQMVADNFVRWFGAGKIVIFLGAVLAELFMLMAVFGGAKTAKAQKAERQAQAKAKAATKGSRRR